MKPGLYKLSVLMSVLGLSLMYASSLYIEPPKVDIGSIDSSWNGRPVTVEGEIQRYINASGNAFIDLGDTTGNIAVLKFEDAPELSKGERIAVEGNVELYRGEIEIIADKIEKIGEQQ